MFEYEKLGKMKYSLWPVKETTFGWFSNSPKKRDTPLAEYGAGTILYFQFAKHMACVFLALSLLSLPALCLYYSGNTVFAGDVKGVIRVTSLGNIGAARPVCNTGRMNG